MPVSHPGTGASPGSHRHIPSQSPPGTEELQSVGKPWRAINAILQLEIYGTYIIYISIYIYTCIHVYNIICIYIYIMCIYIYICVCVCLCVHSLTDMSEYSIPSSDSIGNYPLPGGPSLPLPAPTSFSGLAGPSFLMSKMHKQPSSPVLKRYSLRCQMPKEAEIAASDRAMDMSQNKTKKMVVTSQQMPWIE